jgi:acetyltransferase-like isoleucine patch superfamily enzyme
MKRRLSSKGPVVIGDKVWIGDKVTILSGVTIGDGAVVAANSVVAKDVPAYCVVAGVAAKVVKQVHKSKQYKYLTRPNMLCKPKYGIDRVRFSLQH